MKNIHETSQLINELEKQLLLCMRCGMCQAVCPLFNITNMETDVARGKLALLDGLRNEILDNPVKTLKRLNKCLLCGSCADNCPSGVNVLEIFMKARIILTNYIGLSYIKKIILRGVLSNPQKFNNLFELAAKLQGFFTISQNKTVATSSIRFISPLLGNRHIRNLATIPFHKQPLSLDASQKQPLSLDTSQKQKQSHSLNISQDQQPLLKVKNKKSNIKVAFYVGCLIDKIYPHIAMATIDVLNYYNVEIYMPQTQACCGIPAIASGDIKTFNSLLSYNLALFEKEKYDILVTSCATCTSTIKKIWPMMTAENPNLGNRVNKIAAKTMDISQFLVTYFKIDKNNTNLNSSAINVTWHDPCHLKKSLNISLEPRKLIGASSLYNLIEMEKPDWCCGMGGSFNLQYYDISNKIGQKKRECITATKCECVATGCPACMVQISDILSQNNDKITVKHVIEIYAQQLGISH